MPHPKTALGRYLQKKKLKKVVKATSSTLQGPIQDRLDDIATHLPRLPAGALCTALTEQHAEFARRIVAPPTDDLQAIAFWALLDEKSRELEALAPLAAACGQKLSVWSTDNLQTLRNTLNGEIAALRQCYAAELQRLTQLDAAAHGKFNARDFTGAEADATTVYFACQAATNKLVAGRRFVADSTPVLAKVKELRDDPRRATDAAPQLVRMGKLEATMKQQALAADFDGAIATCATLAAVRRLANRSAKAKPAYESLKGEIESALLRLGQHLMAPFGKTELQALDRRVKASMALCTSEGGGWQKGENELKMVREEMGRVKKMLDALIEISRRQPIIRSKLEGEGMDARLAAKIADQAVKLICEEGCTNDEAIAMAKDADDYATNAALSEPDALMSARVKHTLQKEGVPADKAKAVGRNVRCAGAANGEDTKAVARQVARMSVGVIDALNNAGTVTVTCRGPVTQAIPDLCGEQPRGWPPTMTWDNVPGVYSPSGNQIVVGTMEGPDRKRKVPGPGEGPLPHGTPDLVGHEAGHGFDVAGGGMRSQDPAFLAARQLDATDDPSATPPRARKMVPPGDNYFLTAAEGGANTAGATSETFAESFAMHFGNAARWPALEKFWQTKPFGI